MPVNACSHSNVIQPDWIAKPYLIDEPDLTDLSIETSLSLEKLIYQLKKRIILRKNELATETYFSHYDTLFSLKPVHQMKRHNPIL